MSDHLIHEIKKLHQANGGQKPTIEVKHVKQFLRSKNFRRLLQYHKIDSGSFKSQTFKLLKIIQHSQRALLGLINKHATLPYLLHDPSKLSQELVFQAFTDLRLFVGKFNEYRDKHGEHYEQPVKNPMETLQHILGGVGEDVRYHEHLNKVQKQCEENHKKAMQAIEQIQNDVDQSKNAMNAEIKENKVKSTENTSAIDEQKSKIQKNTDEIQKQKTAIEKHEQKFTEFETKINNNELKIKSNADKSIKLTNYIKKNIKDIQTIQTHQTSIKEQKTTIENRLSKHEKEIDNFNAKINNVKDEFNSNIDAKLANKITELQNAGTDGALLQNFLEQKSNIEKLINKTKDTEKLLTNYNDIKQSIEDIHVDDLNKLLNDKNNAIQNIPGVKQSDIDAAKQKITEFELLQKELNKIKTDDKTIEAIKQQKKEVNDKIKRITEQFKTQNEELEDLLQKYNETINKTKQEIDNDIKTTLNTEKQKLIDKLKQKIANALDEKQINLDNKTLEQVIEDCVNTLRNKVLQLNTQIKEHNTAVKQVEKTKNKKLESLEKIVQNIRTQLDELKTGKTISTKTNARPVQTGNNLLYKFNLFKAFCELLDGIQWGEDKELNFEEFDAEYTDNQKTFKFNDDFHITVKNNENITLKYKDYMFEDTKENILHLSDSYDDDIHFKKLFLELEKAFELCPNKKTYQNFIMFKSIRDSLKKEKNKSIEWKQNQKLDFKDFEAEYENDCKIFKLKDLIIKKNNQNNITLQIDNKTLNENKDKIIKFSEVIDNLSIDFEKLFLEIYKAFELCPDKQTYDEYKHVQKATETLTEEHYLQNVNIFYAQKSLKIGKIEVSEENVTHSTHSDKPVKEDHFGLVQALKREYKKFNEKFKIFSTHDIYGGYNTKDSCFSWVTRFQKPAIKAGYNTIYLIDKNNLYSRFDSGIVLSSDKLNEIVEYTKNNYYENKNESQIIEHQVSEIKLDNESINLGKQHPVYLQYSNGKGKQDKILIMKKTEAEYKSQNNSMSGGWSFADYDRRMRRIMMKKSCTPEEAHRLVKSHAIETYLTPKIPSSTKRRHIRMSVLGDARAHPSVAKHITKRFSKRMQRLLSPYNRYFEKFCAAQSTSV